MEEKKMSLKEFWIRLVVWALFSVVFPCVFLAYRFGLTEDKGTQLSGGGIFIIVILSVFFVYMIKSAKSGMPEGSMAAQCINGYALIIPLIALVAILRMIENNVVVFEQTLIVFIASECIAVPINPMPRWAYENKIERSTGLIKNVLDTVLNKKDK